MTTKYTGSLKDTDLRHTVLTVMVHKGDHVMHSSLKVLDSRHKSTSKGNKKRSTDVTRTTRDTTRENTTREIESPAVNSTLRVNTVRGTLTT